MRSQNVRDGFHGDFGSFLIWKVKFSCGDAAERDGCKSMAGRQFEARAVTGGQCFPVPICHMVLDDGTHGVEDVPGWEIVARCELGPSGWFWMSLRVYKVIASIPQLKAGC